MITRSTPCRRQPKRWLPASRRSNSLLCLLQGAPLPSPSAASDPHMPACRCRPRLQLLTPSGACLFQRCNLLLRKRSRLSFVPHTLATKKWRQGRRFAAKFPEPIYHVERQKIVINAISQTFLRLSASSVAAHLTPNPPSLAPVAAWPPADLNLFNSLEATRVVWASSGWART